MGLSPPLSGCPSVLILACCVTPLARGRHAPGWWARWRTGKGTGITCMQGSLSFFFFFFCLSVFIITTAPSSEFRTTDPTRTRKYLLFLSTLSSHYTHPQDDVSVRLHWRHGIACADGTHATMQESTLLNPRTLTMSIATTTGRNSPSAHARWSARTMTSGAKLSWVRCCAWPKI